MYPELLPETALIGPRQAVCNRVGGDPERCGLDRGKRKASRDKGQYDI